MEKYFIHDKVNSKKLDTEKQNKIQTNIKVLSNK